MATAKFTIKRGARFSSKEVALSAGAAEAQSDTMSLNVDITKLTKGEAIQMLEGMKDAMLKAKWPPL